MEFSRAGYSTTFSAKAVSAAILMSRFDTINRYLGHATVAGASIVTDELNGKQCRKLRTTTLPTRMDRQTIDKDEDDITHPAFNPVLSDLLPGHRFVHKYSSYESDAYRVLKTENVQFTRFWEHDLTTKKDAKGVPSRTKHFWTRLWRALPWTCPDGRSIGFIAPELTNIEVPTCISSDWDVSTLDREAFWKTDLCPEIRRWSTFRLKDSVLKLEDEDKAEHVCRNLETFFEQCGFDCHCCKQSLLDRCFWCKQPEGWHLRCRNHANFTNYRWKPGTLYDRNNVDVDISIYQMLDRAESP